MICLMTDSDRFFYPILTHIIDSFSCSQLNTEFLYVKRIQKVPEYAEMQHTMMTSLYYINDVTCLSTCGCLIFIFPKGW